MVSACLAHTTGSAAIGPGLMANLGPGNDRQPSACSLGVDGDLDLGSLDRLDPPPIGEARLNLGPAHSPRSPVARLLVAEAQHEVPTPRNNGRMEASDKARSVAVIEH